MNTKYVEIIHIHTRKTENKTNAVHNKTIKIFKSIQVKLNANNSGCFAVCVYCIIAAIVVYVVVYLDQFERSTTHTFIRFREYCTIAISRKTINSGK